MSTDPVLIGTVIIFSVYSAGAAGTNAIYYPFVSSVLHAGPWFFGLATSLYFGANLVGGLLIARHRHARLPLLGIAVVAALLWGGIAVVRSTPVLLLISFAGGLLYSLVSTVYESTIQLRAPEGLAGQTASTARALTSTAQVAGMLVCGLLAERLGPAPAFRCAFLGGTTLIVATGFALQRSNRRWNATAPQSAD